MKPMDASNAEKVRSYLQDSLAILASPAEAQKVYLERLGTLPLTDELVLEFDDWAGLVPQLAALEVISPAAHAAVNRLLSTLEALQAAESDWELEQLRSLPEWQAVRRAAGLALVELLQPVPAGA